MALTNMGTNTFLQSNYLHLSAAGSDGSDGSVEGVHLRWDLVNELGDVHIPKGNIAQSTPYSTNIGFNKADDFVMIYRAQYDIRNYLNVNFQNAPSSVEDGMSSPASPHRRWIYRNLTPSLGGSATSVVIRFNDHSLYDTVRQTYDPATQTQQFMNAYTGILEIEPYWKLCFVGTFMTEVSYVGNPFVVETVSKGEPIDHEPRIISSRTTVDEVAQEARNDHRIQCENIQYFRINKDDSHILRVEIECYEHFITAKQQQTGGWTQIGEQSGFSLSLSDTVVQDRLEKASAFVIDHEWPKFNNGDAVSRDNYWDRWSSAQGLKEGVALYLLESVTKTNPQAEHASEPPNTNIKISFGLLEALRLAALDFHHARMLGLGYIDPLDQGTYVYLAEYFTEASLPVGPTGQSSVHHLYCSLPTSTDDQRLPDIPELVDITYGVKVKTKSGEELQVTKEGGYSLSEPLRYVNLHADRKDIFEPYDTPGFTGPDFNMSEKTRTIFYGVEYKHATNDSTWREQELSHDTNYTGYNPTVQGLLEVVPIVNVDNPVYRHIEREEGEHEYALYAVNLFSRPTDLSNTSGTDETVFEKPNTLLPPLNLTSHYIQEENPVILSTVSEQQALIARNQSNPTADNYQARVTFWWNHIHNINYQLGDKVQFLFREEEPLKVQGGIVSVTMNSTDPKLVDVATGPILLHSRGYPPGGTAVEDIVPDLNGNASKFLGGAFIAGGNSYVIMSIDDSGTHPVFTIAPITDLLATQVEDNRFESFVDRKKPSVKDNFLALENLTDIGNWHVLQKEVELVSHSSHTEVITLDDNEHTLHIGGVIGDATIEVIPDVYDEDDEIPQGSNPGDPIPNSESGMYKVDFDSYVLSAHPDSQVSWYGGTARIPIQGSSEKKVLEVFRIETHSGNVLRLYVYDPEFDTPDPATSNLVKIVTGTGVEVNFHPGYRVYLEAETGTNDLFNKTHIVPQPGSATKFTYFAARSRDSANGKTSLPSIPNLLLGRRIIVPVPPGVPMGPLFATRPDFYGKSSYTFDVEVEVTSERKPFALQFFKANQNAILSTLYKQETIDTMLQTLPDRSEDEWFTQRWHDLVNMELENGQFKSYSGDPSGFQFPNPDNEDPQTGGYYYYQDPLDPSSKVYPFEGAPDPGTIPDIVAEAIASAFVSLTEQPVIYDYISDANRQTSPREPMITDAGGNLLSPTSPGFDPFPMVRRFQQGGSYFVRFTDYKLDGAANNFYFFFGREISDRMTFSANSPIAGPIQLVNAEAPMPPKVRKVITRLADPVLQTPAGVEFEIAAYAESDRIGEVSIYRAYTQVTASSIRTMEKAASVSYGEPVIDDFADLPVPPFGQPIFYRLTANRKILNEDGGEEMVPSIPSDVALASIVDNINPEAPELSYDSDPPTSSPVELQNVVLSWSKSVHNGTYYLYKMNDRGNWNKIFEITTNDNSVEVDLANTSLGSNVLSKEDEDGNTIYHRFKVDVVNASGLLNLSEKALVI